jgi:hypothetical protein
MSWMNHVKVYRLVRKFLIKCLCDVLPLAPSSNKPVLELPSYDRYIILDNSSRKINFLILSGKDFKKMDMISWSSTSLNIANNQKKKKNYTLHTTYNIAIWRPALYIPFNCDISSWIKCIIGFCRNIKETKLKNWILKSLYIVNFILYTNSISFQNKFIASIHVDHCASLFLQFIIWQQSIKAEIDFRILFTLQILKTNAFLVQLIDQTHENFCFS